MVRVLLKSGKTVLVSAYVSMCLCVSCALFNRLQRLSLAACLYYVVKEPKSSYAGSEISITDNPTTPPVHSPAVTASTGHG